MDYLAFIHPFRRIARLRYAATALGCMAAGWIALTLGGAGGDVSRLGALAFWPALYVLFVAIVNRMRDARASAGWLLFPIFIMVVGAVTAYFAGPFDITGYFVRGTMFEHSFILLPFRFLAYLPSMILPFVLALLVSLFFWCFSLIMLAFLPSRPAPG